MLVSPGWGLLDVPREESRAWSDECLFRIAEAASSYGIRLALEHLTPQSSNLLTSCRDVTDTLDRIGHPSLAAVLDLGQMSVFGEHVSDYIRLLGAKLVHVHVMDGAPARHLAFGDGILPVEEMLRELEASGYTGRYTLEINDGRYAARPHEALAQCVREMAGWRLA